jgi:hypothetical protein
VVAVVDECLNTVDPTHAFCTGCRSSTAAFHEGAPMRIFDPSAHMDDHLRQVGV